MILDLFGALIQELGDLIKTPLAPDKNNVCLLKYKTGMQVQIEMNRDSEEVLVVSYFPAPPRGRYRETVFREALKENLHANPRIGTFAYSKKEDTLVFFSRFPAKDLRGAHLAEILPIFTQYVESWMKAIEKGEPPPVTGTYVGTSKGHGLFGLS